MKRFRLKGTPELKLHSIPGLIWDPEAPFSEASMGKRGAFNVYHIYVFSCPGSSIPDLGQSVPLYDFDTKSDLSPFRHLIGVVS